MQNNSEQFFTFVLQAQSIKHNAELLVSTKMGRFLQQKLVKSNQAWVIYLAVKQVNLEYNKGPFNSRL